MAIKLTCPCGKRLAIEKQYIGRKIACPGCGKKFVLDRAKIAAMLPSADKGTAPQAVAAPKAPTPPPVPGALDDEPADLDRDILTLISDGEALPTPPVEHPTGAPSVILVQDAVDLPYARGAGPGIRRADKSEDDAIQAATHSFWADLALAFVYPVQSLGNALTLGGILLLATVQFAVQEFPGGCMFLVAWFVLYGWFCSFYMSVVLDTAAGSPALPGIKFESGFWEDVIRPALYFILAQAIVFVPPLLLLAQIKSPWPAAGCFAVGLFLWPMIMLLLSLAGHNALLRVDLVALTIFRTFPSYLVIAIMLAAVTAINWAIAILTILIEARILQVTLPKMLTSPNMAFQAVRHIVALYFSIVAMRLIGLYYLHNKQRFAFELE